MIDLISLCEQGRIPDPLARWGMRRLIARRLDTPAAQDADRRSREFREFLAQLRAAPIAINTDDANRQHYEVPAAFFHAHLGPNLKYSCCHYPADGMTLADAEHSMLTLYAERAELADGQRILDLGCGWGSLSLWLAQRYPHASIVGLSNSSGQRDYILARAQERGLRNLQILTGNIASFEFDGHRSASGFDRVISIEMFEHMKNYERLMEKIASWLNPQGLLFVHLFAHKVLAYHFEDVSSDDWMSRYFFTGGTMPNEALLLHFQQHMLLRQQWWLSGTHYQRTADHWLANVDAAREKILPLFRQAYGPDQASVWFQRWRMFYMAVSELFGYAEGNEWGVGHYLFQRR